MVVVPSELEELSSDLVVYAARLVRAVRRLHEQPAAIRVLALLDELGPTTVSALARADRCSQPTMSLAVARLMESGEVTKTGDPADARRTVITLTRPWPADAGLGPARQRRQRGPAPGGARHPFPRGHRHRRRGAARPRGPCPDDLQNFGESDPVSLKDNQFFQQPRAVWAVAFACVIAFMGIGLVDPILKPIADQLDATPSQVSLLFTSYMAVMGVAMLLTGVISSRWGAKRTLLAGLALIIVFSALAGASDSIGAIVGFRAGWGFGNALFIATALATIVPS